MGCTTSMAPTVDTLLNTGAPSWAKSSVAPRWKSTNHQTAIQTTLIQMIHLTMSESVAQWSLNCWKQLNSKLSYKIAWLTQQRGIPCCFEGTKYHCHPSHHSKIRIDHPQFEAHLSVFSKNRILRKAAHYYSLRGDLALWACSQLLLTVIWTIWRAERRHSDLPAATVVGNFLPIPSHNGEWPCHWWRSKWGQEAGICAR